MTQSTIKLIIVDLYGVLTRGTYRDTCRWLARRYRRDITRLHDVLYFKYFTLASLGKITEQQSFTLAIRELNLPLGWRTLRRKHLSFQRLNLSVFRYCRSLQRRGYTVVLLTEKTRPQLAATIKKLSLERYFPVIINTLDLRLPKASAQTIRRVLQRFQVQPAEAVMVDEQAANLAGAKALGVKTVHYKNFKQFRRELNICLAHPR